MKKTRNSEADDMLPEYNFDYSKARQNRFARADKDKKIVLLDPDVADFFTSSESVNNILRAIIAAMPKNNIENLAQ